MIKLSTNTTQTIKFIPRQGVVSSIVLENETTSDIESITLGIDEVLSVNSYFDTGFGGFGQGWINDDTWIIQDGFLQFNVSGENYYAAASQTITNSLANKPVDITVVINEVNLVPNNSFGQPNGVLKVGFYDDYYSVPSEVGTHTFKSTPSYDSDRLDVIVYYNDQPNSIKVDSILVEHKGVKIENNYTEANITLSEGFLQEGQTYTLKVLDNLSNVLFYDKVFCTDQTDYTINKDEFKSYSQSETYKTFKG